MKAYCYVNLNQRRIKCTLEREKMGSIINFFSTVTGTELSYVLVFLTIIDVAFAALAIKSLRSSPLRKAALIKLAYALVPAFMNWGERFLSSIDESSQAGQNLIVCVIAIYFIMVFTAELVSIGGYYKVLNPTATNLLSRLADRFAPVEVKDKMDKLGLTEVLEDNKEGLKEKTNEQGERECL